MSNSPSRARMGRVYPVYVLDRDCYRLECCVEEQIKRCRAECDPGGFQHPDDRNWQGFPQPKTVMETDIVLVCVGIDGPVAKAANTGEHNVGLHHCFLSSLKEAD